MNQDYEYDTSKWTGLSTRAINALTRENEFNSKKQISAFVHGGGHLDHLPFIGPKTRDEILEWLAR